MNTSLNKTDRAIAESEYFKNSIPSIVLAIVTVVLSALSFWYVQPNILERYRSILNQNFTDLGLSDLSSRGSTFDSTESILPSFDNKTAKPSSLSTVLSLENRKRLLIETQLCLRRLAIYDNRDDSVRYRSAIVAQALADLCREQARNAVGQDARSSDIAQYLSRERSEINRAIESMQAAQRLKGPNALGAALWLSERKLQDASLGFERLDDLEATVRALLEGVNSSPPNAASESSADHKGRLLVLLAKILTIRSLKLDDTINNERRLALLSEAVALSELVNSDSLSFLSWRALSKIPFDKERARDWGWGAVQDFWSRGAIDQTGAEELDSVFRSLLVGENIEEAQTFIFNQLKKLPGFEQPRFRELAAATCLRQLVANQLIENDTNKNASPKLRRLDDAKNLAADYVLLDLAIRLQPEINGLPELLIEIAKRDSNDSLSKQNALSEFVWRVIETSDREGLRGIVEAIKKARLQDFAGVTQAIERVAQDDMAFGMLATKVVMTLVNSDSGTNAIDQSMAVHWLQAINKYSEAVLSAWFARGNLHLKAKEFDQAIECFELLSKRVPDSQQVRELLDTARAK